MDPLCPYKDKGKVGLPGTVLKHGHEQLEEMLLLVPGGQHGVHHSFSRRAGGSDGLFADMITAFKTSLCCKSQDISDDAFQHAAGWCGGSQQMQFRTPHEGEATHAPESSQKPGAGCCKPWARDEAVGDGPGGKINLWAFKNSCFLHPHLQQPHTFYLHAAVSFLALRQSFYLTGTGA